MIKPKTIWPRLVVPCRHPWEINDNALAVRTQHETLGSGFYYILLRDDVKKWLNDNLIYLKSKSPHEYDEALLLFNNMDDVIRFKLVWGGRHL